MPVYGNRPEDVVVDAAGNVQTGATLTLHASQADAQAGSSVLATVVTSAGRWSADVSTSPVWVRTPNGAVYQIADISAYARQTGGVVSVTGPTLPPGLPAGTKYVWNKTDAATGDLLDILTGVI